jgi:hypothetical protein
VAGKGKAITTAKSVISADARTRTTTVTVPDAQGQKVSNTLVYDRQ